MWKNENSLKKPNGVFTILSAFIFLIFSSLGLSMLFVTQIYVKISGYKKNQHLLEYAAENGIKKGFHQFFTSLTEAPPLLVLEDEKYEELRDNTKSGGGLILENWLGADYPFIHSGFWDRLSWTCQTSSLLEKTTEQESYFQAVFRFYFNSTGGIQNTPHKKHISLFSSLDILSGHIPIASIPILIGQIYEPEDGEIQVLPLDTGMLFPGILDRQKELLPRDILAQINSALNIKMFSMNDLTNSTLRQALGLEVEDSPVPQGVYLIRDDLGLGGIFVQGNVDELLLAIENNSQVMAFTQEDREWILKFTPEESRTVFETPQEIFQFERLPRSTIIVNGSIQSLGGGIVDASGRPERSTQEIPCLLDGVRLTLVSPDTVTITSHLLQQRLTWIDEIPYLKYARSQLNLLASGTGILDNDVHSGKILIAQESPSVLKIQASLTASGEGLQSEGEGKTIYLTGSLHVSEFRSPGNIFKLIPDRRSLYQDDLLLDAPLTARPVLYPANLRMDQWNDNKT